MRRIRTIRFTLVLMILVAWPLRGQEVVDRMLAIVDGRVITAGDLDQFRALAEFYQEEDLPETDQALLDRVIESVLVRVQVERVPGIRATEEDVDEFVARFSRPPDLEFPLSQAAIREGARHRIESGRYFTIRFPQEVTPDEIATYYETVYLPEAESRDEVFSLDEVEILLEALILLEKTQLDASEWAQTLLERSQVEVVESP